ncbi:Down syndrome cell adhesion molecule homolog [Parambassis ranga]|uniref:Down syndrome cell adhesion molecule homolog n=1 Tax=Parambassis ranga TaxID=210632 RepID=A0A6P7J6Q5_9TELE|nr:Down syndrome cell adhesion molecule homolog [Parambassis ranga]
MNLSSRRLALCCSLLLGCVSAELLITTVGSDVTLICNYDVQYYGRLSACWGRGAIPNRGCGNEVIKSDGTSVISRLSERYLLMGDLAEGDVSLTIRQVEEADSGTYGCRVDIPGWFNDHKHHVTLAVNAVRPNPLKIETREVKERTVTVRWSSGFDGGRPITIYRVELKNKQASWDTAIRTDVANPELTQVTLVDLRPAKAYNLRMFAINNVGMSESSNVLTVTTKEAAPEGPPVDMLLEAISSDSIRVSWKPPRPELRNGILRGYSISYREYDPASRHFKRWQHLSVTATRDQESIILMNLKPSVPYGVLIQAKTNAGIGPASTAPLCSTLEEVYKTTVATSLASSTAASVWVHDTSLTSAHTASTAESDFAVTIWEEITTNTTSVAPDPPSIELKAVKDNTLSISWTAGFEGDSPITGYCLEYKAASALWDYTKTVVDFGPEETEATIIEINPSTYNIRMFARNSMGTSKASNVLTITTGEAGQPRDEVIPTIPTDSHASESAESHSVHPAAIIVPVLLIFLTGTMVTAWQIRRVKQKQGSLSIWLSSGVLRYRGSESLQEL